LNFNNRFQPQPGVRKAVLDVVDVVGEVSSRSLSFHLKVADSHVDMLNELPMFRDLPTAALFNLLPKRYHKFVPPIGEDLQIREAAFQREERMARAVIIGILAKPEHIEQHQAQRFLERL
jgi:hypothetical protein